MSLKYMNYFELGGPSNLGPTMQFSLTFDVRCVARAPRSVVLPFTVTPGICGRLGRHDQAIPYVSAPS